MDLSSKALPAEKALAELMFSLARDVVAYNDILIRRLGGRIVVSSLASAPQFAGMQYGAPGTPGELWCRCGDYVALLREAAQQGRGPLAAPLPVPPAQEITGPPGPYLRGSFKLGLYAYALELADRHQITSPAKWERRYVATGDSFATWLEQHPPREGFRRVPDWAIGEPPALRILHALGVAIRRGVLVAFGPAFARLWAARWRHDKCEVERLLARAYKAARVDGACIGVDAWWNGEHPMQLAMGCLERFDSCRSAWEPRHVAPDMI